MSKWKGWSVQALLIAAAWWWLFVAGCDTINYYDPHAGCTEVWVLEGFRWDEDSESWVVRPGHRPKKLIWRQEWDCHNKEGEK